MQWSINTPALCSKPYWLPRRPSRKSSRGLVRVCVCVFVFPQMSVNPFFCVCGFVVLIINARVSKNVYICVIKQAFVSAGRGAVPSANANGFAVFDLLLGWPQITGAHFYESDMSSHSKAGHGNTSTHKVLWGNTPDLLINVSSLAFLEREWPKVLPCTCQKTLASFSMCIFLQAFLNEVQCVSVCRLLFHTSIFT